MDSWAAGTVGIKGLTTSLKTWDTHREAFEEFVAKMVPPYNPHQKVGDLGRGGPKSASLPVPGQASIMQFMGRLPKELY